MHSIEEIDGCKRNNEGIGVEKESSFGGTRRRVAREQHFLLLCQFSHVDDTCNKKDKFEFGL